MARNTSDDKFSQPDINLAGIGLQGPRPDSRDISTAQPQFDKFGNSLGFGWKESDGSVTLIGGQRYTQYGGSLDHGATPDSSRNMADYWLNNKVSVRNNPAPTGEVSGDGSPGGGLPMAIKKLAAGAVPAVIGRTLGGNSNPGAASANLPPEFQQLLALAMRRMSEQEPLFRSINAQAMGGLPTAYQKG